MHDTLATLCRSFIARNTKLAVMYVITEVIV